MSCSVKGLIILTLIIFLYPKPKDKEPEDNRPEFYDYAKHRWVYKDSSMQYKVNPETGLYIPKDSIIDYPKGSSYKIRKDSLAKNLTEDEVIQIIEDNKY